MEDRKVLLSIDNLHVKFRVRGRILTAIRGITLDIYENESIAIVGESGSGKSVFTKTFAGMLDSNGFVSEGSLIFDDPELADTYVALDDKARQLIEGNLHELNESAKLEAGAATWRQILDLESEKREKCGLSAEEKEQMQMQEKELIVKRTEAFNLKQTLDPKKEKEKIRETARLIKEYEKQIKELQKANAQKEKDAKAKIAGGSELARSYDQKIAELKEKWQKEIQAPITPEQEKRNEILAKEIHLSVGRYDKLRREKMAKGLREALKTAMQLGIDLNNEVERNRVFDNVTFRVRYLDETGDKLHGNCILNLAKIKYAKDWQKIRGRRIATVFQDPMTSLDPIVTIGKQITSIIIKHQQCSEVEARRRAIELMAKVGIPHPEARFDDYPFQYSGGMRQRIVIAIALSCQPKILICDEPTTALDVTIQAQILQLIKDLQKEFHFTTVFITHDLGVVANIADRVAVLYAGQIVELGTVEDVFYDPRHPYTWALLSSLPQLGQKNTKLYSITGTPPSLYNQIVGDAFAPRNPYCMKIDTMLEPPMFRVSDTHYAKTWLLEENAPKVEKPEIIQNIHEKLVETYHIGE